MFVSLFTKLAVSVLAASVVFTSTALGQPESSEPKLGPLSPSVDAAWQAFQTVGLACRTVECLALKTILQTDDVMFTAAMTPTRMAAIGSKGVAYVARITRPAAINGQLERTLLRKRMLFPAICARLQNMSEHYGDPKTSSYLTDVGHLLQMAELIDTRTHGHCLPDMITPLPHTAEIDRFINYTGEVCAYRQ